MAARIPVNSPPAHLLTLGYHPTIPASKLFAMEGHAKRLGLPLAALEMLGRDEAVCDAFLRAAAAGDGVAFARSLEAAPLPLPLTPRRRPA